VDKQAESGRIPPHPSRSVEKMSRRALAWLFLGPLPLTRAGGLTEEERDSAIRELEASRRLFLNVLAGLTEAQWRFKPAPAVWSIAECAEHVAVTEDFYFRLITEKIMKSPAEPARRTETAGKDDFVLKAMPDRTNKRKTVPALEPTGRWPSKEALIAHFQQSRNRLIHYVRTTSDDLRNHFRTHRAVGLIDGYEWILLASGHVRRHVKQIEEVKANPNYPR